MSFDLTNENDVAKAYEHGSSKVSDYYMGSLYQKQWNIYGVRNNAFHRRPEVTAPKWRSQLYFGSYYIAVQTTEAQFKAAHASEPFITVSVKDNSIPDAEAKLKAQLQNFDINYDLAITKYKKKLFDNYHYVGLIGTGCGREYIRTKQDAETIRKRSKDQFGIDFGPDTEERVSRKEYTATQIIHPLNFGHDVTKNSFEESEWGTVRFELRATELYKMLGNPNYHQPGIKKLIKAFEDSEGGLGFVVGTDTFYSEHGNDDIQLRRDMLVVNEIYTPMRFQGNRDDVRMYKMLYNKAQNAVLQIIESDFVGIPYWKTLTNPKPDSPYGIGPNDPLLPINYWRNSTTNQYIDYGNAALKFMYEVQAGNIIGGVNTLINGLPNGILPLEEGITLGQTVKGLDLNKSTIPSIESMINLIAQATQEFGASGNARGHEQGSNANTATGISLLADRADDMTAALMDNIDMGIQKSIEIKIKHQQLFFNEEKLANVMYNGEDVIVPHYPGDLSGTDYTTSVKRELGDAKAGRALQWLKILTQFDQVLTEKGSPLPPQLMIDSVKSIGQSLGVPDVDEMMKQIESAIPGPVEVGAPQQQPQIPGQPGQEQSPVAPQQQGQAPATAQPLQEVINAALA